MRLVIESVLAALLYSLGNQQFTRVLDSQQRIIAGLPAPKPSKSRFSGVRST